MLVSILTRPEGRVLPGIGGILGRMKAGFNPHPTRRPGATEQVRDSKTSSIVSILTRPEGRVLPILLRFIISNPPFQSSPDPKAGCYPCKQPLIF